MRAWPRLDTTPSLVCKTLKACGFGGKSAVGRTSFASKFTCVVPTYTYTPILLRDTNDARFDAPSRWLSSPCYPAPRASSRDSPSFAPSSFPRERPGTHLPRDPRCIILLRRRQDSPADAADPIAPTSRENPRARFSSVHIVHRAARLVFRSRQSLSALALIGMVIGRAVILVERDDHALVAHASRVRVVLVLMVVHHGGEECDEGEEEDEGEGGAAFSARAEGLIPVAPAEGTPALLAVEEIRRAVCGGEWGRGDSVGGVHPEDRDVPGGLAVGRGSRARAASSEPACRRLREDARARRNLFVSAHRW